MKKNIAMSIMAGKLAVGSQCVFATGLGKSESPLVSVPPLTLDQLGAPINILTPPIVLDNGSKTNEVVNGCLYTQLAANRRIDFIINGVQNNQVFQVYLAYSKAAGRADQWITFTAGQGQLELELESLQLLAGLTVQPKENLEPSLSTPLGVLNDNHETVILPVNLSELDDLGDEGDALYFQAIVLPINDDGEFLWDFAQASEVDKYIINRTNQVNPDFENIITDGKLFGEGSKSANACSTDSTDSGGK